MVPILEADGFPDFAQYKFVRIKYGKTIAYGPADDGREHDDIALENGLIDEIKPGVKPKVGDGGLINQSPAGGITIMDSTRSCDIEGDRQAARKETKKIVGELTGEKVYG